MPRGFKQLCAGAFQNPNLLTAIYQFFCNQPAITKYKMKNYLKKIAPAALWRRLRTAKHHFLYNLRNFVERLGFIVTRKSDYYAPTPSEIALRVRRNRWAKPSPLYGISFDLDKMEDLLKSLCADYLPSFQELPTYENMVDSGFGPGYPRVDALVLYCMLRRVRPSRYLEVGSGLSTAYAHHALLGKYRGDRCPSITCIEPFPFSHLNSLSNIELVRSEVQDVSIEKFTCLEANDVLFIDSSHIVKLDGDVPFLFLEALPQLQPGVIIHVHDIPFPFNVPFPPEYWTLLDHPESPHWPMFWNEAMLIQALLSGSSSFEIILSLPMLRYHREANLRSIIPSYKTIAEEPNTFSSLWLRKKI